MSSVTRAFAAKATITVTLTSLGSGSARECTALDNTANKYLDALVRVKTNGQGGSTAMLDVFAYAALGDTTYTDGATGTDAAFTAANRLNARYVGSVQMNAATGVIAMLPSIAAAFGGVLPDKWGLIFVNNSGAALSAVGGDHVVEFEGITDTVA